MSGSLSREELANLLKTGSSMLRRDFRSLTDDQINDILQQGYIDLDIWCLNNGVDQLPKKLEGFKTILRHAACRQLEANNREVSVSPEDLEALADDSALRQAGDEAAAAADEEPTQRQTEKVKELLSRVHFDANNLDADLRKVCLLIFEEFAKEPWTDMLQTHFESWTRDAMSRYREARKLLSAIWRDLAAVSAFLDHHTSTKGSSSHEELILRRMASAIFPALNQFWNPRPARVDPAKLTLIQEPRAFLTAYPTLDSLLDEEPSSPTHWAISTMQHIWLFEHVPRQLEDREMAVVLILTGNAVAPTSLGRGLKVADALRRNEKEVARIRRRRLPINPSVDPFKYSPFEPDANQQADPSAPPTANDSGTSSPEPDDRSEG